MITKKEDFPFAAKNHDNRLTKCVPNGRIILQESSTRACHRNAGLSSKGADWKEREGKAWWQNIDTSPDDTAFLLKDIPTARRLSYREWLHICLFPLEAGGYRDSCGERGQNKLSSDYGNESTIQQRVAGCTSRKVRKWFLQTILSLLLRHSMHRLSNGDSIRGQTGNTTAPNSHCRCAGIYGEIPPHCNTWGRPWHNYMRQGTVWMKKAWLLLRLTVLYLRSEVCQRLWARRYDRNRNRGQVSY